VGAAGPTSRTGQALGNAHTKRARAPACPLQVHALNCAVSCLCDRGDFIICEEFAYTHAPECIFIPRGLHMLPVSARAGVLACVRGSE